MALTRVREAVIAVRDLESAAKFYREALGLPVVADTAEGLSLAVGETVVRLFAPADGEPASWLDAIGGEGGIHHLAFETDAQIERPGELLDRDAHLGLGIALLPPAEPQALPPPVATGLYIDHIVIASNDSGATSAWFSETLGAEIKRKMIRPGTNAQLAFAKLGEVILEFAGPPEPRPGPHTARYWGMVFAVTSLDDILAHLRGLGYETTDPREAVQPGARIASLKSGTGRVPFALIEYGPRE